MLQTTGIQRERGNMLPQRAEAGSAIARRAALCEVVPERTADTDEDRREFCFFHSMPMMSVLKSPPQRLISPAETPRVKNAQTDP